MFSDRPPVSFRTKFSEKCIVLLLVCLCVASVASAAGITKKKTATRVSKPVFSVSVADSGATMQVAHQSTNPASVSDSAVRSPAGGGASAKTKDSTVPVQATPAGNPIARPEPKKGGDTAATHTPVTVVKPASASTLPAAAEGPRKKHTPLEHSLLFRILAIFGSIVVIAAAFMFMRKRKAAPRFLTTTRLSVMDREVQRACKYIEKNFADAELSVANVCHNLVTGEAFLEALMERELGVTVNDFISHVRVNRAKQILGKNPSAEIDVLAQETGFASSIAFLATFKKLTGTPFESYADQRRKN
jgi:AraC-like DNA-binding protein